MMLGCFWLQEVPLGITNPTTNNNLVIVFLVFFIVFIVVFIDHVMRRCHFHHFDGPDPILWPDKQSELSLARLACRSDWSSFRVLGENSAQFGQYCRFLVRDIPMFDHSVVVVI